MVWDSDSYRAVSYLADITKPPVPVLRPGTHFNSWHVFPQHLLRYEIWQSMTSPNSLVFSPDADVTEETSLVFSGLVQFSCHVIFLIHIMSLSYYFFSCICSMQMD